MPLIEASPSSNPAFSESNICLLARSLPKGRYSVGPDFNVRFAKADDDGPNGTPVVFGKSVGADPRFVSFDQ